MAELVPFFGIRTTTAGDVVTVTVLGEVDLANVGRVRTALFDVAPGSRLVVCDLTQVSFLGCCALTTLLDAREHAARHGADFEVVATSPAVLRPIALSGLLSRLRARSRPSTVDPPAVCAAPVGGGKVGG